MNASPIPPSQKHVDQILLTMRDKKLQPIYVHCVLGRDRTSLTSGLYRIYFLGVSKNDAWREMRQSGFKTWWILRGLKSVLRQTRGNSPAGIGHSRGTALRSQPVFRLGSVPSLPVQHFDAFGSPHQNLGCDADEQAVLNHSDNAIQFAFKRRRDGIGPKAQSRI